MTLPRPGSSSSKENPKSILGAWLVAAITCAISGVGFFVFAFQAGSVGGTLVFGFFLLIGLATLYDAIRKSLDYAKFGSVRVVMQGDPPRAGGRVDALIELPAKTMEARHISATLECIQVTWTADSRGRLGESRMPVWSAERLSPIRSTGQGCVAAVGIAIPDDQAATDVPGGRPEAGRRYFSWNLRIAAAVPGLDLQRNFDVTVLPVSPVSVVSAAAVATVVMPATTRAHDARQGFDSKAHQDLKSHAKRKAIESALSAFAGLIAITPFVLIFGATGLALVAGCPASYSRSNPPHCSMWGVDWGSLMVRAHEVGFDYGMFAIPLAAVVWFGGKLWLDRRGAASGKARAVSAVAAIFAIAVFVADPIRMFWRDRNETASQRKAVVSPGKDMLSEEHSPYINLAGRGIMAEVHGGELRVRVNSIRVEKRAREPRLEFNDLGVWVWGMIDGQWTQVGQVVDRDVRGTLSPESPTADLGDKVFVVPNGAACARGSCQAKLLLTTRVPGQPVFHTENTAMAALSISASQSIAAAPAEIRHWDVYLHRISEAIQGGRTAEAERLFGEALEFIERKHGKHHPYAAAVLRRQAQFFASQRRAAEQEKALLAALAILERYTDAEVNRAFGSQGAWFDQENLERDLGEFYWNERRYAESYARYRRAYDLVPKMVVAGQAQNYKYAFDSAGIMKTACMIGEWDAADRAMVELKRRIGGVPAHERGKLEYWIRTGEPRLAARKC